MLIALDVNRVNGPVGITRSDMQTQGRALKVDACEADGGVITSAAVRDPGRLAPK